MPPANASAAASAAAQAAQARDQLIAMLTPLIAHEGYDLEDVTVTRAGRRSVVRVVVDADGGIDLDAVSVVSRVVSDVLDAPAADASGARNDFGTDSAAARVLRGSYVLEVSSPGVDRPLTEPRHWRRAVGRLVSTTIAGAPVTGRVAAVDDSGVQLEIAADSRPARWEDLGRGSVQIEFNRPDDVERSE